MFYEREASSSSSTRRRARGRGGLLDAPRCAPRAAPRAQPTHPAAGRSSRGTRRTATPSSRPAPRPARPGRRCSRGAAPTPPSRGPSVEGVIQRCEGSYTDLPEKPLWVSATALVHGVRAAGGTWAAYRRLPRKEVLRLRSLSKRGRAKATDPVIDRVFQLPNELAWCVLDFWRATSAATGEVI